MGYRRTEPVWLGALVLLCLSAPSWSAAADVRLRPAADGSLGAWLIAGPVSSGAAAKLDPGVFEAQRGAELPGASARWRMASHREGALDLARLLNARAGFAAVGGVLEVPTATEALLLLGVDGGVSVWLDGKRVFQRDKPALRGSGFEPVALSLPSGSHRLLLWLENALPHWASWVRIVNRSDGLPPAGLSLRLPGTDSRDVGQLGKELLQASLELRPSSTGYRPQLNLSFPRGYPESLLSGSPAAPSIKLYPAGSPPRTLRVGQLPDAKRGVRDLSIQLPSPKDASELRVDFQLGAERRSLKTKLDPALPTLLLAAARQLKSLGGPANRAQPVAAAPAPATPHTDAGRPPATWVDPAVLRDTLEWLSAELVRATEARDDRATRAVERQLEVLTRASAPDGDPLRKEGVQHLALRSPLDSSPQPFAIHFPRGYASRSPSDRYPLVLLLHGYTGSPDSVLRAFLDSTSDQPRVSGIVIAPHAHGDAFYRDAGEAATLASLNWALATLPIDPDRVSVTGVSMGGTGTGYMALRYPDRFSAASPLCGYHSYFIRRDTSKRPLRAWERARMHHWSPASWAENGRHVPMFVAQGTKDFPHDNSKVLIQRYRELGYSVSEEWPETGHNVWDKVWNEAAMWGWLSTKRRAKLPDSVSLITDSLRYGKSYWVEVTGLEESGPMASLTASATAKGINIKTSGVQEFRLVPPLPHGITGKDVELNVDGDAIRLDVGTTATPTASIVRDAGHWQLAGSGAAPSTRRKRAGVEGPIRDVFMGPTLFVYGTRRAATSRATLELARNMAKRTADLAFKVLSDRELEEAQRSNYNLVLVGGAADNLTSYSMRKELKSRTSPGKLFFGAREFSGDDVAAIYIQPSPASPDHYVVVVESVSAMGFYLTPLLPQLLPDFLIYGRGVAPASTEQVLGGASVLAGGFFDQAWNIPKDISDAPIAN